MTALAGGPGCGSLGLHALLCCVFEKNEGPMVHCSDPPQAVGPKVKQLGRYLLPETFCTGRVVSIVLDDHLVLGAPVYIEDTQYDRNCFQFNICMVISSHVDPAPHRDLAQHLAQAFEGLEVDLKLLSKPEKCQQVQSILVCLREQLNRAQECFVRITPSHCISFRIRYQSMALTASLGLADVPLPLVNLPALLLQGRSESAEDRFFPRGPLAFEPDLTLLHLVPFLDGVRTVRDIVDASRLDEERVFICLRHLLHFGLIAAVDEIRLENRYCLTPKFHSVVEEPGFQAEVVHYVTARRQASSTELIEAMIGLYATIDGWQQTLGEFQQAHAEEMQKYQISLRHFITFGLLQGLMERVYSYTKALSIFEMQELQKLRSHTIPRRKQELKDMGHTSVNKDPEILQMVARMNELKAKEKPRTDREGACNGSTVGKRRTSSLDSDCSTFLK